MRHSGHVVIAAFSPDENWVATASKDSTARIWDARTGFPVTEPLPHRLPVSTLAWMPDSRQLLTGSRDGLIRRWNLPAHGIAPLWLPDLAEALAGKGNETAGGSTAVSMQALDDLRRLAAQPGNDPDLRWLHWFLIRRLEAPNSHPEE
jgi:WD40 repeat protein